MESIGGSQVQERIKRMVQARKQAAEEKKNGRTTKEIRPESGQSRCSQRIRPMSSKRLNSAATTTASTNEISTKTLITRVFEYGIKLEEYINKRKLNAKICEEKLLNNELFVLSLLNKLKKNDDKEEFITEEAIIEKLERVDKLKKQSEKCIHAEEKLNRLLNNRLESLKNV